MAFAETFKALSDPVRREILQLLKNGKMSAGEIGGSGVGDEGVEFCVL